MARSGKGFVALAGAALAIALLLYLAPRYRTLLLTPETRFLAVTRARGLAALDIPTARSESGPMT